MITGEISTIASLFIIGLSFLGAYLNYRYYFKDKEAIWRWIKLSYALTCNFIGLLYIHILISQEHVIPIGVVRWVVILLLSTIVAGGIVANGRLKYGRK